MGLIRYWKPPSQNEQIANGVAFFSILAVPFFFLALGFKDIFFSASWLFSVLIVLAGIKHIAKSNATKNESKIGIDIGILAAIFLTASIILHIFILWLHFTIY